MMMDNFYYLNTWTYPDRHFFAKSKESDPESQQYILSPDPTGYNQIGIKFRNISPTGETVPVERAMDGDWVKCDAKEADGFMIKTQDMSPSTDIDDPTIDFSDDPTIEWKSLQ